MSKNGESYQVKTIIHTDDTIEQELYQNIGDRQERIMRWLMNTREEQIRQGLIELGWTPPRES